MWWVKWISLDSLHTQNQYWVRQYWTAGKRRCLRRREKDWRCPGKEPGEGVIYAVKGGKGGAKVKGKAWESILLCYHVSRGPLYCGQDTKALASNWWLAKVWRKHELQFICCCYPFKHATQHRCYRCYRHVLPMPLIYSLCSSYSIIWWKYLALKVDSSQSTS